MQITIKLFALLAKYLPDGAEKNQLDIAVAEDATVQEVIHGLSLPSEHCHLVLVDGVYVAPSDRETLVLKEGQALAIWPPVAGG